MNFHLFLGFVAVVPVLILSWFVAVLPAFILRILGIKKIASAWMHFNGVLISRFVLWVLRVKVHVSGNTTVIKNHPQRVCYVANHTSILDILASVGYLRVWAGFIAKAELRFVPIVNAWIKSIHCIYIYRRNLKKSGQAIEKGIENIKKNIPMFIFPEGTRSKTGIIAPFKHGSFRLATRSQATIVPITIKGIRRAYEGRKRTFAKVNCYLHVGNSVETTNLNSREETMNMVVKIEKEIREVYDSLPND